MEEEIVDEFQINLAFISIGFIDECPLWLVTKEKLTCDSRIFNEMGIKYETSLKHRSDSHINQSLTYQRGRIKVNGRGNRL